MKTVRRPASPSPSPRLRVPGKDRDFPWFDPQSRIERATEIVPLWVAESVLNEAETWLRTSLPADWPATLAAKAERCFAGHSQFHRLISARGNAGNAGRANLLKFMRHWLSARLLRHRPALYRLLPSSFTLGLPLRARTAAPRR